VVRAFETAECLLEMGDQIDKADSAGMVVKFVKSTPYEALGHA